MRESEKVAPKIVKLRSSFSADIIDERVYDELHRFKMGQNTVQRFIVVADGPGFSIAIHSLIAEPGEDACLFLLILLNLSSRTGRHRVCRSAHTNRSP